MAPATETSRWPTRPASASGEARTATSAWSSDQASSSSWCAAVPERCRLLLRRRERAFDAGDRDRSLQPAVVTQRSGEDEMVRRAFVIVVELERDGVVL